MTSFSLDFVGIGAAKSGTTWLAECLREHPQVCLSRPKELNYFCERHIWPSTPSEYGKGEEWLSQRFPDWRSGQIRGEFSVSYLVDALAPVRISWDYPQISIIASFRNPTDALYSLYYQGCKEYPFPDAFDNFLERYPRYLECGFYFTHISRYLQHFPAEQMHLVLYDDICSDPRAVVASLFEFLRIDPGYQPPIGGQRVNVRKGPRSKLVRDLTGGATIFVRQNPRVAPLKKHLNRIGLHRAARWIQQKNLRPASFPPMNAETRARLLEVYADETARLGDLLNRDLSHWNQ